MKDLRKPVCWLGDSRDRLRRFPDAARRDAGHQLNSVQARCPAKDSKPMPLVGPGVIEIRVHLESEYRVLYLAKFEEAVYVLHAFVKKTRKSSSLDIELGRKRYRELLERRK
ncbi:MAG: type II toxin-antitoxin system RelE/ParE family toxin [Bryobacteraceae bacterium]